MITNNGRRVVGKPKGASRERSQGRLRTQKSNGATRGAEPPPGFRNGEINAMSVWGGNAPTGKASAQATILQYAGLCGGLSLILVIMTVLYRNSKKYEPRVFLGLSQTIWLFGKSISFALGFLYGLFLKCYWRMTDFKGRSKLRSFFIYLVLDFVLTVVCILSIVLNMKAGEASLFTPMLILLGLAIVFTPCEIAKLLQIIESENIRKLNEKKARGIKGQGHMHDPEKMPTAMASPVASHLQSPESHPFGEDQFLNHQPSAPSEEALTDSTHINIDLETQNTFSLIENPFLPPQDFEQMWLNMPKIGGFEHAVEGIPALANVREHLESHSFGIIASGFVGEGDFAVMRTFLFAIQDHQFASRSINTTTTCTFLAEIVFASKSDLPRCIATFKCTQPEMLDAFVNRLALHKLAVVA
jgi:hypothetical protein